MVPDISANAARLGERVLQSLPAQFLALVLLNALFVGGIVWFLAGVDARRVAFEQAESDSRERVLSPVLAACIDGRELAPPAPRPPSH
jgi:hypothetical protein